MTEEEDIDGLAAEYVLGSLDSAERAEVEARRRTDAALAASIQAWERRLGPLSEGAPELQPPPELFQRVLARLAEAEHRQGAGADVLPFRSKPRRKLAFGAVTGALAACLALVVVWRTHTPPGHAPGTDGGHISCGSRYKDFWESFDRDKQARISAEQLAGISRMALRAYDACEAGDEQDAKALFDRMKKMPF